MTKTTETRAEPPLSLSVQKRQHVQRGGKMSDFDHKAASEKLAALSSVEDAPRYTRHAESSLGGCDPKTCQNKEHWFYELSASSVEDSALLRGAMNAQDERERKAGELCGVPYDQHGCDWPDAVAEKLIAAEAALARAKDALRWAMGYTAQDGGTFPPRPPYSGGYWWRSELAKRAGNLIDTKELSEAERLLSEASKESK